MFLIDVPTVYLTVGALYIFVPFCSWLALSKQPSPSTHLWCLGSMLFGISLILIGLRSQLPDWVSYPLANGLTWFALMMMALGLHKELDAEKKTAWPWESMLLIIVACVAVFEYFRLVVQSPQLRFQWAIFVLGAWFSYIAFIANKISTSENLRSARWLSVVFIFATFMVALRIFRVAQGVSQPDAVTPGLDSAITASVGLLTSILGNFAMVAMVLERAQKNKIDYVAQNAREEESRRLSEQIEHLERQRTLGVMSASFAHELSQPLTAILMDIESIKSALSASSQPDQINAKEVLNSLKDLQKSAEHTVQLVGRIRNFIRPTQSEFEHIDFAQIATDVLHLLAYEIRQHGVQFNFEFGDAACYVTGDRVQLSQIVLNVYRNAIEAVHGCQKRWVLVSLEEQSQRVILRVCDSGSGVPFEIKDKVGQPFVTSKAGGLGVGLSISSTIAEKHGGSLTITNAVDGGAVVELNLPAAQRS